MNVALTDIRIGDQVVCYHLSWDTWWGPPSYRVTSVTRGCTCPEIVDQINWGSRAQPRPEHIHLECELWDPPEGRKNLKAYFNGYDAETLCHVNRPNDFLVIGERGPEPQMGLFDAC